MKWWKYFGFLRSHRTGPYIYLAVTAHCSSRLGVQHPDGNSGVINAPSVVSGMRSRKCPIALVSKDSQQLPGVSWGKELPSIAWRGGMISTCHKQMTLVYPPLLLMIIQNFAIFLLTSSGKSYPSFFLNLQVNIINERCIKEKRQEY